jgi:hypothetical protein
VGCSYDVYEESGKAFMAWTLARSVDRLDDRLEVLVI